MVGDGGLAVLRRPSPAMAYSGEEGYSFLVTKRGYTVQVRVRGGVGELGRVHGRVAAHGAQQCSHYSG